MMMHEQEPLYRQVGQRVREAREAAKMTQGELGKRIGLTRASITNIETARQNVQLHTLYAIAEVLQVSASALLPPLPATQRGTSIRLQQVLERTKTVTPRERLVLEEMLAGATPVTAFTRRRPSPDRSKKST